MTYISSCSFHKRYLREETTLFSMISVENALQKINKSVPQLSDIEVIKLQESTGRVLATDVISQISMPPFRQSAMDGYALCLHEEKSYKMISEVKAGDDAQPVLQPGECVRIFTGAPVPDTANAVIMQEKTTRNENEITIQGEVIPNANIRPAGEQVQNGQIALQKGTVLTAAGIGFLASLGTTNISVFKKPSIAIIATGNELIPPGNDLAYGQIYESNSAMLEGALTDLQYDSICNYKVKDNYEHTLAILKEAINKHDVVLVSGGISVGDYDFVGKALTEIGIEEIFYKIKQKPGKPLLYGKYENTLVFALPGNPAAALSCLYVYALKAIKKLEGNEHFNLIRVTAKSNSTFIKKGDRAQFLKAVYSNNEVTILEGQSSAMLQTFAVANAFVFVDEDEMEIAINDQVNVILFPTKH